MSAKNTTNSTGTEDKDTDKVTDKDKVTHKDKEEKIEASASLKTEQEGDVTTSVEEKSTSTSSSSTTPAMIWFHVDFMGSKGSSAEPQGMRAVYEYIKTEIIKSPETDIK